MSNNNLCALFHTWGKWQTKTMTLKHYDRTTRKQIGDEVDVDVQERYCQMCNKMQRERIYID